MNPACGHRYTQLIVPNSSIDGSALFSVVHIYCCLYCTLLLNDIQPQQPTVSFGAAMVYAYSMLTSVMVQMTVETTVTRRIALPVIVS